MAEHDDGRPTRIDTVIGTVGQTGGSNQFNIGIQPRRLTEELKANLLKTVPKMPGLSMCYTVGDADTYHFAHEIFHFLRSNGYALSGMNTMMGTGLPMGVHFDEKAQDGPTLYVGIRRY